MYAVYHILLSTEICSWNESTCAQVRNESISLKLGRGAQASQSCLPTTLHMLFICLWGTGEWSCLNCTGIFLSSQRGHAICKRFVSYKTTEKFFSKFLRVRMMPKERITNQLDGIPNSNVLSANNIYRVPYSLYLFAIWQKTYSLQSAH